MYSRVFLTILFALSVAPYSAGAVEQLDYSKQISPSLKYQIGLFLEQIYDTDIDIYNIAKVDLNSDGLDEHILKRKSCDDSKALCIHSIIAEKNGELILLSKIMARNIVLANTYSHGIKDILVFKNEINDYNFNIYVWSPSQKMYIMNDE